MPRWPTRLTPSPPATSPPPTSPPTPTAPTDRRRQDLPAAVRLPLPAQLHGRDQDHLQAPVPRVRTHVPQPLQAGERAWACSRSACTARAGRAALAVRASGTLPLITTHDHLPCNRGRVHAQSIAAVNLCVRSRPERRLSASHIPPVPGVRAGSRGAPQDVLQALHLLHDGKRGTRARLPMADA